jgi:putative phosphoribosyl transferase
MLGRLIAQRGYTNPVLLGITPTGVEIAAEACTACGAPFDVIVGASIRLGSGLAPVGGIAESSNSEMDPDFQPGFNLMPKLEESIATARAAVNREKMLFRGTRPIRKLAGATVVLVDGQIVFPWKMLACARAATEQGARVVALAAAAATQAAAERLRDRGYDFTCPSIVMDPNGHRRPFGEEKDPSQARLSAIVVARQAA